MGINMKQLFSIIILSLLVSACGVKVLSKNDLTFTAKALSNQDKDTVFKMAEEHCGKYNKKPVLTLENFRQYTFECR